MPANSTNPKIIAAIPAYNEVNHIKRIVSEAKSFVDQVIVVDDSSTDGTGKIAEAAGALVIRHEENMGKGVAVNTAFKIAREMQPCVLVLLDGDGQHNPREIPLLIEPILQDRADMVVGSRFLKNNHIPKYRVLGQTVLNLTTGWGSGIRLTDSQSGFRAFSLRAIQSLSFCEKGFAVESEMQFRAKECGLRVAEVPIETNYEEKLKRSPVVHGFGVLFRVIKLTWERCFNGKRRQRTWRWSHEKTADLGDRWSRVYWNQPGEGVEEKRTRGRCS